MTTIVRGLERNGLVRLEADPSDHRIKRLWLTPRARELERVMGDGMTRLRHWVLMRVGSISTGGEVEVTVDPAARRVAWQSVRGTRHGAVMEVVDDGPDRCRIRLEVSFRLVGMFGPIAARAAMTRRRAGASPGSRSPSMVPASRWATIRTTARDQCHGGSMASSASDPAPAATATGSWLTARRSVCATA